MTSFTRSCAAAAAVITLGVVGVVSLPSMATAEEASPVTSVRSFRGMNEGRTQLFAESSSVAVDEGTDWGGAETLDVPQTKSQAEKDAEAAQQRAEEEARRQAEQQAAAAASSTVSRSQVRTGTDSGLASYTNIDYRRDSTRTMRSAMSATVTPPTTARGGRTSAATSWGCRSARSSATAPSGRHPRPRWATGWTIRRA